ncbi:MAG TPA: glycoside hydrolase family 3 protein [Gemmatimonadales bacterium]
MSLCRHAFLSILVFTVITPAGTSAQVRAAGSGLAPLSPAERSRVTRLMRTLPLRQRIAQLIMPWIPGTYAAFDDRSLEKVRGWVDTLQVGGIIVSVGSPLDIAATLNFFQRRARLPLLIASDLEGGTSIRFQGGTPFPTNMGVGAGGRVQDAYAMGRVTALEGRAAGIHLTFSPVADVNNNAANPIINTRSFGGNAKAVGRMVAATVRGIQDAGMLATAKHFPGHGDTDTDSHIALPVIRSDWRRLDSLELIPFRDAIAAGVRVVMTAHVAMPGVVGDAAVPATLSPEILTGILRDSLGFKGLVVTDALNMGALVNSYGAGEATVRAFLAGSDLLLMPTDPRAAIDAMVEAVELGRVSRARLDASLRRMLEVKARLGLFRRRTVNLDSLAYTIGRRAHRDTALAVSARSLVLVRDTLAMVDSLRAGPRRIAVVTYADAGAAPVGSSLIAELTRRGHRISSFRLTAASGPASYDSAAALVKAAPMALFATAIRVVAWRGAIGLPEPLVRVINDSNGDRPTMVVSFGTPYLLSQVPRVSGYLIGWTDNPLTEEAVAAALSGAAITGRLPIELPPAYPLGFGLQKPRR